MKYYGQFNPPVDQTLHERYFADKSGPGFFIECGAFDGLTECSCLFFEESLGWQGINIEPSPIIYSQLVRNRPQSVNVNIALSDRSGQATFHQVIHPQFGELCTNGSLTHSPDHQALLINSHCTFHEYTVETITWNDLIRLQAVSQVDLFVLDVEGHELSVLRGMLDCSVLPRILCIEHSYVNMPELLQLTSQLGYRFDVSVFVNSFFIRSE